MITVSLVTAGDDLVRLVAEINQAAWDPANAMSAYDVPALAAYLAQPDTRFVACHEVGADGRTLLGIASARLEPTSTRSTSAPTSAAEAPAGP